MRKEEHDVQAQERPMAEIVTWKAIERPPYVASVDSDAEVLGFYLFAAGGAAISGGFGLLMAHGDDRLTARQRTFGGLASAVVAATGLAGIVYPSGFARRVRRLWSPVLPAAGLMSVAASSPRNSPMYFPSVALTAIGGASVGAGARRAFGALAGVGYLAAISSDQPWRPWPPQRELIWNLAMGFAAFPAAGVIGARLGHVALSVRALERARFRDRRQLGEPETPPGAIRRALVRLARSRNSTPAASSPTAPRAEIRERIARATVLARELDQALLELAESGRAEPPVVRGALKSHRDLHHLTLGRILLAAAQGEALSLPDAVSELVDAYREGSLGEPVSLVLDLSEAPHRAVDARTTVALMRVLKRALDNTAEHADRAALSAVRVRLAESHGGVELEVENDGRGRLPDESDWGIGLTEANAACKDLGGTFEPAQGRAGPRLCARVPALPAGSRRTAADGSGDLQARIDAAIDDCAAALRISNVVQGLGCLFTASDWRSALRSSAAFLALTGIGELRSRGAIRRDDATLAPLVFAMGLLWPVGGRPASGYIGAAFVEEGVRARRPPWRAPAGAVSALLLAGIRARATRRLMIENTAFPLVCAATAAVAAWARRRLERAENEAVSLRDRADLIRELAPAVANRHDVVDALKKKDMDAWLRVDITVRERLNDLGRRIGEELDWLLEHLHVPEPAGELQEHLGDRLDPVEVTVGGTVPILTDRMRAEHQLGLARRGVELIAHADGITELVLQGFPADLLGRWSLRGLHIGMRPARDDGRVSVEVVYRPQLARVDGGRRNRPDPTALAAQVEVMGGEMLEGFDDGTIRLLMPVTALATVP